MKNAIFAGLLCFTGLVYVVRWSVEDDGKCEIWQKNNIFDSINLLIT